MSYPFSYFSFKEPSRMTRSLKTKQQAQNDCETLTWSTYGNRSCWCTLLRRSASRAPGLLRKEVIQPQVPLRLPCYDFTPVTDHSLGTSW